MGKLKDLVDVVLWAGITTPRWREYYLQHPWEQPKVTSASGDQRFRDGLPYLELSQNCTGQHARANLIFPPLSTNRRRLRERHQDTMVRRRRPLRPAHSLLELLELLTLFILSL